MKRKLLFAALCAFAWVNSYAVDWTDKTSLITNPSFETDAAVSDATGNALNSATVTGWTILPTTAVSNAQAATVNSSSKLSVLNGSDGATTGSKYFYVRQNWNATGNFGIEQTIPAENLPAGLYLFTCKIKTSSSSPNNTKWYLSIKEGEKDAIVNEKAGSAAEWLSNGVVLYKESSETALKISAYFVAGADGGGYHYAMLLDDFELKYVSPTDMGSITASSTLDLSGVIYNAGIYNASKTVMPRGWIAYASTRGNSYFTEGTGDTQLEGWSGSNMNIDYYQQLSNLPVGKYTVTARAHDTNDRGAVVYGWSNNVGTTGGDMGADYADVTTDALAVTNGTMNIGIKHNGGASWVTGDNFRVTYLGIQPLYDEAKTAATTARDDAQYANVVGVEKTNLQTAIALTPSTYEDYISAIEQLNTATANFTAAKANYDALVAEIANAKTLGVATATADGCAATSESTATSVLSNINNLNTLEYTAVTTKYDTDGSALFIPEWTVTSFDGLSAQHWSGESRTYYDKWSASSFNCSISRVVTLPQGHYVFYAAGRGQANSASAVTLKVAISGGSTLTQSYTMKGDTGKGIDTSGAANFGEGTFANSNNGRGWEWRYIAFDLAAETEVTLSIEGAGNNSWVSACDTKLLTYENIVVSQNLYNNNKDLAIAARDNALYTNVQGVERAALVAAINASVTESYEGYNAAAVALENATNAFIAAKTNWDALVREIGKATALGASTTAAEAVRDDAATTSAGALAATQALKVAEYTLVSGTYGHGVALGTWTTTGSTGSLSSQHWSGETREYLEQSSANWAAGSWTIKYDQNVTLPAGNYVFKVAGRQADSDGVTLSLTVKNGDTVLGSVSDFPRGDRGLGITTSGATSFDPNDTFCNTRNNNGDNLQTNGGNGWEWRYVKFTLADEATVNVAVDAVATTEHMWVSFCDATVQTDNEANIKLIAYNIALADAQSTLDDQTYKYVGGTDRSNLSDAIDADATLDKTDASAIEAATTDLNTAKETFTAGVASWNAYVLAKNTDYADDQPYASAEKYAAIATAKSGTVNTASEAATKAAAITSAYRLYVESNALAEGVSGAENKTTLISDPNMEVTYDGTAHTFGAWQVFGQTDGKIQLLSDESFTDGSGKNDYKYADIYKSDNNAGIKQTISNLAPGKYMLTVTARAQTTASATFGVFAGSYRTEINRIGASRGVFDRGWNDASVEFYVTETSDVEIGVQSGNGKDLWWSATRFRLVKLADIQNVTIDEAATVAPTATTEPVNVTLTRSLSPDYWNTFCSPVAITAEEITATFGEGAQVREMNTSASVENNVIPFKDATSIAAGVPYLVKPTKTVTNPTFNGKTVVAEGQTVTNGDYKYIGILAKTTLAAPAEDTTDLDLYLSTAGTMKKPGTNGANLKGMRAYFNVPAAAANSGVKLFIDGETDAIDMIDGEPVAGAEIFNLAGQRVNKAQRGIYIINGKKVLVK